MAIDPNVALFVATVAGDLAGVEAALLAGADPDKADPCSGPPPLTWAAKLGRVECAMALMKGGANPWGRGDEGSPGGAGAPIGYAMELGRWEIMELMVDSCPPEMAPTRAQLEQEWGRRW